MKSFGVVMAEFQRDWAREATVAGIAAVLGQHGGGSAVAFAWEMQLLNTRVPSTIGA